MIVEATDTDERVFEVRVKTPSWHLAKYIMSNHSILSKSDKPDIKAISEVFETILKECIVSYREPKVDKKWVDGFEMLPATVTSALVAELINQSRKVAEIKVKTEKN